MKPFKIYSAENAQPPADELLTAVDDMLGFVPNVFAVMAESTPTLQAFIALNQYFSESGFDATSREIIQIAASVENDCDYCVAGHTAFAQMQNVSSNIIEAVRNNQPISDPRLEALNQFTRSLVKNRGNIPAKELHQFLAAGYSPAHVLEVILGIGVKIFSNFANNVIGIPLDDEFTEYTWKSNRNVHIA